MPELPKVSLILLNGQRILTFQVDFRTFAQCLGNDIDRPEHTEVNVP